MDKYCKFCGTLHTATDYPKNCEACNNTTWINPTPVAVLCLRVWDAETGREGILVGQRGIEPKKGLYGLPGGFVDRTDTSFEAAAVRELYEEMGIKISEDYVFVTHSFCDGRNILVFCSYDETMEYSQLKSLFRPSDECPEMDVLWADEPERELCFPSHTNAARLAILEFPVDDDAPLYDDGHC